MVTIEQAKGFYKTITWQKCREYVLTRDLYLCQECLRTTGHPIPADTVHHIEHLRDNWERRLDPANLVSVCRTCHNRLHPEKKSKNIGRKKKQKKNKKIKVIEMNSNPEKF
ncbi:HNH endonuclease [Virgibacillus salexigens]|uniref:Putative HNH nuclease YajD n=1 Tax=Virgibacillus massiliensis TaxID=1462526 RepID=A0A024QAJ7_9BACI|nr:HNH endonuclease signature motif containing protein [Virgibacillus massiliensis]CDQ39543.1 HNH endonuclease [Virgibacillus massiliensis]